VYAKTPLGGPAAVLDYLSRYTHRTAIGNERLLEIGGERVLLRVRADAQGGRRVVRIDALEFIARWLQHVLPRGFKRIRHYGLLAATAKARRLALARAALQMPAPNPRAVEDARAFMRRVAALDIDACPHCRAGRLRVVEQRAADRAARVGAVFACRGPPVTSLARSLLTSVLDCDAGHGRCAPLRWPRSSCHSMSAQKRRAACLHRGGPAGLAACSGTPTTHALLA